MSYSKSKVTKSDLVVGALLGLAASSIFVGIYYQSTPEYKSKMAIHRAAQLRQQTFCENGLLFIDQKGVKAQILSTEGKGLPCQPH